MFSKFAVVFFVLGLGLPIWGQIPRKLTHLDCKGSNFRLTGQYDTGEDGFFNIKLKIAGKFFSEKHQRAELDEPYSYVTNGEFLKYVFTDQSHIFLLVPKKQGSQPWQLVGRFTLADGSPSVEELKCSRTPYLN
jgi:hypothetical protein